MASSSSFASNSQYCPRWKYDVFLSFRGADTRKTFTSHLYEGLKNRGIFTFQDDKRLEQGDSISGELLKAIKESQVALIVFSRNYATSRWCLNELVKIMECKEEENGQTVIPIFYDVDPSHVRYQSDIFAEAFAKHESRYKDDVEGIQKVKGWRTALTAATNLKGYDIRDEIESEKIQQIIDHISSKFCKSARFLSYLQDVVGIHAHLEELKSLLQMEINDVRIVGIWGIGGIGKTTIAKAIFDTLSHQFKAACFLANVKENAKKNQLHSLQNTLLSELLRKKDDYVNNEYDGKCMIQSRLSSMKVLIVLDDIDHGDHLEYLAGDVGWFGNGSRVIVTTRNRHLIEKDAAIYEVPTLPDDEAMQLFNQHAFKKEVPDECFKKFSLEVVNYAKGHPLALKLQQFMSLRRIDLRASKCLKRTPDFKGMPNLEYLNLKGCTSLEEVHPSLKYCRKLIKLNLCKCESLERFPYVNVESLESLNLKYCYSLEKFPEILRIMKQRTARKIMTSCTGIRELPFTFFDLQPHLTKLHLSFMKNLVSLPSSICKSKGLVRIDVSNCSKLESLPEEIGDLKMLKELDASYTLISRPPSSIVRLNKLKSLQFQKRKSEDIVYFVFPLVNDGLLSLESLDLSYCNIIDGRLPEDIGSLSSLKHLNLSYCNIINGGLPEDIGSLSSLKTLCFCGNKFEHLPRSISQLGALEYLDLSDCKRLTQLPKDIGSLSSLKHLNLSGNNFKRLSQSISKLGALEYLDLSDCKRLTQLPEDIGSLSSLKHLNLSGNNFKRLSQSISKLGALEYLDLSDCKRLTQLPEDIGSLSSLKELNLSGNNFECLPQSISKFGALEYLDLSDCKRLTQLPEDIGWLLFLKNLNFSGNNFEHLPRSISHICALEYLDLSDCKRLAQLPEDIGCLLFLEDLNLSGTNFEHLPRSISQICALEYLDLSDCKRLTQLPEDIGSLFSLKELNLSGNNFEHLPRSIAQLGALEYLDLSDSKKLTQLPEFPQQLYAIHADWSNDSFCNSLFQNISSLQHAICSSHSLSLRVFSSWGEAIPSWFKYQGMGTSVSINLPKNWYVSDNFLGFAVCYSGELIDYITAHLIPLCDDGMSSMTQEFDLSNNSIYSDDRNIINFLLVPLGGLWDASNANGKAPNDYGCFRLYFPKKIIESGVRLWYK
ncbi:hypothetical protein RDI58_026004 [Solanum bulbocastanum]|uniref:ADP-ribosyl cyclase/cyclic ADP-ribose hydrolase n=1 Tax=Solanum bulbocastanum TaxID=147425 RepID=A0AAN8Y2X8_SOLBU